MSRTVSFVSFYVISLLLLTILPVTQAFAEIPRELNQQIEEEYREQLESTEKETLQGEKPWLIDWGGWNTFYYAHFEGYDQPAARKEILKNIAYIDNRVWTKVTFNPNRQDPASKTQELYIRLKQRMQWENQGRADYDNITLDMGYITLRHSLWTVRFGRQFMRIGRGIVYQDIHDGFDIRLNLPKWQIKTIVSKTRRGEKNIDTSQPGYGEEHRRWFFGTEARYRGFRYHKPYIYFLSQNDRSREKPDNTTAGFRYNSQYFGGGSEGQLFLRQLRYWTELMFETGESYLSGSTQKKPIHAWGTNMGVAYYIDHVTKPQLNFEYLFGSGDPERGSVTNTTSGNTSGNDLNFLYFGTYRTGFATNFRISNIHIFRAGISAKLLKWHPDLKKHDVTAGVNAYWYRKNKNSGVISDIDASNTNNHVGEEINFFVDWRITSDLLWSFKFGAFNTGEAFNNNTAGEDSNLKFLSTNLTLTF